MTLDEQTAMGQYMAAHGRRWDCNYVKTCRDVFGDEVAILVMAPQTFRRPSNAVS